MIKNSLLNRVAALSLIFPLVSLPVVPGNAADVPQSREQIQLSFAPLVKNASPAVVNIYAKKIVQQRRRGALFDDPLFQRFFGRQAPLGRQRQRVENSLGSGVIVREGGIVITNHHVIGDAQEIRVVMADRREFPAELLLKDERTDLAVLRLVGAPEDLPVLEFGNSEGLEVGDLVIAIGNPFGVGQTVTSGIVSGLARTSVGITDFRSFIQTDAAINPGNSGGALINLSGKVIGINTAIYSKTGGNMGIGFAVPASMANAVVESAISGKPLVRPWLGFSGRDVDYETAEALGMDRPGGVLVESIYDGSPAADSGIRPGDVILEVDAQEVEDAQTLRFKLATKGVGGRSELGILRSGDRETIGFDLIAPPEDPPRDTYQVGGHGPLAGTEIVNLSPAVADEVGLPTDQRGVMVMRVAGRSLANRLQIKPGTKILSVNGEEITSVDDVRAVVADPPGEWHLVVEQNGRKRVIEVR
ncbi:Do family serine endopeptidase [Aestuariispira insulae]|uniref:Do/DeqQ family serine protease n=1 Tax=Aestuariispira insulae TaxID=1461337 RepID=A0A3D9HSM4_9PROT|nr:Do family serine endopeptidase [Aestuariispira insulae]RED52508.1 Do/DeqQ family serine protease [Aestuariispira insulae]